MKGFETFRAPSKEEKKNIEATQELTAQALAKAEQMEKQRLMRLHHQEIYPPKRDIATQEIEKFIKEQAEKLKKETLH